MTHSGMKFQTACLNRCGTLLGLLLVGTGWIAQCQIAPVNPGNSGVIEERNISVPMRDGVELEADLFLPSRTGQWPAILVRTPYDRRSEGTRAYIYFARHGYAVVLQDVRGRGGSGGTFGPISQEGPDGSDTINWIAEQQWSNRRVGMSGGSYLGIAQWWAAVQKNSHLVTIFPIVSGDDEYLDRFYSPGGALKLGHRLLWLSENLTPRGVERPSFDSYIRHVPLSTADVAATTLHLDIWSGAVDHPSYDKYWNKFSIRRQLNKVKIPVSSMGGWFDNYAESDLDSFTQLRARGVPVETWIGPWGHSFVTRFPTVDFGPDSRARTRALQLAWFDRFLKRDSAKSAQKTAVLHVFVMGPNVWREEHEWPLARARFTNFYLNSRGRANGGHGDGELRSRAASHSVPDHFVYDPRHPVPTSGGAICCNPRVLPPGPLNQAAVEERNDVLVYTSAVLKQDLEVTGPVAATVFFATSANDTDVTVKLVDVYPDGRPLLVTDGIQRLRYRMSLDKPVFVKRGVPYEIRVDAGVTSWVFERGHRIRVEISSSNFPRFDRNLNSILPNADELRMTVANQTVLHDRNYPSAVILPVIPSLRSLSSSLHSHFRRHGSNRGRR